MLPNNPTLDGWHQILFLENLNKIEIDASQIISGIISEKLIPDLDINRINGLQGILDNYESRLNSIDDVLDSIIDEPAEDDGDDGDIDIPPDDDGGLGDGGTGIGGGTGKP